MTQARSTSIARLLLLATAAAPAAAAAPHELYQLTHLQGGTAQGIHFISPDEGWTAEDGGRIRHWTFDPTTASWNGELQKTPYDCRFLLRDVFFADPLNGWAVGYGGRVLRTRDGGNFWDYAASSGQPFVHLPGRPELADLYSVHFFFDPTINDFRGWLTGFGGVLMRSDDGGYTWQDTMPPQLAGLDMYAIEVHMSGPYGSTVWVTGDQGRVLSSNDLGTNWTEQQLRGTPVALGKNLELWDVALRTDGSGCVVGGYGRGIGQVFHTSDFGANWTYEDCFLGGSRDGMLTMYGVSLTGTSEAITGGYGDQMAVRETSCWREQEINAHSVGDPAVLGVSGLGDQHVWMCGDFNNIRTTSDSGRTWSYVSKNLPLRLHTGTFLTTRVGFVAGQLAQILKTTDGGLTWNTKYPNAITGGVQIISSLAFSELDSAHGVGVGRAPDGTLLVVWTDNQGETWNEVTTLGVTKGCLNDVTFDPAVATKAWAVGNKGLVLESADSGATWNTRPLPQGKGRPNLQGVCVDGADRVFVVGSDPLGPESGVWMFENDTWKNVWLFDADGKSFEVDLHDVAASNLGVFAVGVGGTVLRLETDGSFHAMFRQDPTGSPLYNPAETLTQVGAFDSTRCDNLWIGGADGSLTVFDGTSWTSPKSGMSETPVLGISLVDTPHGCVGYLIGRYFEVIRLARSDV